MTCDDLQNDLSSSLDGEIDATRARGVSAHLAVCERCRATRAAWAQQSALLRNAGRRIPAPPTWERLAHRIDGAEDRARHARISEDVGPAARAPRPAGIATPPARAWAAPRLGWRFAAGAAAALVLLGTAGVFLLHPGRMIGAHTAPDAMIPALVRQLVDGGVRPDLSVLGAVTPVSWERFANLPHDARFSPVAPAGLPGGYVFDEGWVIDSRVCRMVCARYKKDGRVVAVLQAESSNVAPICTLANPQCCRIAGMMCRRSRVGRVDVVQATHGGLALTVAAKTGETDIDAVMATLSADAHLRKD